MSMPQEQTKQWLEQWVIGLNLCPFAAKVVNENSVRIQLCDAKEESLLIRAALEELELLFNTAETDMSTSLLVYSQALTNFDDYLDVLDRVNDLIIEAGLEGIIQLASFHPDYCFEGVEQDDVSNYTNRSPYPMLHFIREQSLAAALENYPNPDKIPDNNIKRLKDLGDREVQRLLSSISDRFK